MVRKAGGVWGGTSFHRGGDYLVHSHSIMNLWRRHQLSFQAATAELIACSVRESLGTERSARRLHCHRTRATSTISSKRGSEPHRCHAPRRSIHQCGVVSRLALGVTTGHNLGGHHVFIVDEARHGHHLVVGRQRLLRHSPRGAHFRLLRKETDIAFVKIVRDDNGSRIRYEEENEEANQPMDI